MVYNMNLTRSKNYLFQYLPIEKAENYSPLFFLLIGIPFIKITRKSISRILYLQRSACYLSTSYIAATLELITPRLSERAAPIFMTEKNRYTYHCTAKSLPGFTTAELYILSVALVLPSRVTDVIRFAALWCPDFPTPAEAGINKPTFSWLQRYTICG